MLEFSHGTLALTIITAASAALAATAEHRGWRLALYLFKPLTTMLIVLAAVAATPGSPFPPEYAYLMLAGLACSLAGDVFLMLPSDRFVAGLVSFLVAHLLYIAAFGRLLAFTAGPEPAYGPLSWLFLVALLLYAATALRFLYPRLGGMKAPVLMYMLVIVAMAWQASNVWLGVPYAEARFAVVGALLFMASDTILAFDRFRGPLRAAPIFVLGTYFLAQWFLALSIGPIS